MKLFRAIILLSVILPPSLGNAESIKYGQVFSFEPEREIKFPDFSLRFIGRKPNAFFPGSTSHRLGDIYEFRVSTPATNQIIRWSSGTGDIGPVTFEVQGKCFWLELKISYRFGMLEENQAVVSVDNSSPTACEQGEETR